MNVTEKFAQAKKLLMLVADVHRGLKDLPTVADIDTFVSPHRLPEKSQALSKSLDIGCGSQPKNPFCASSVYGLDIRDNEAMQIKHADLTVGGIPHADRSFDFVTAFDFIEHVPRIVYLPERRFPFVELMNEIWRVLNPGGLFFSSTPMHPFSEAYRDPTHVNLITHETFTHYFDDQRRWASMYGFRGSFEIVDQRRRDSHLMCLMRKKG